MCLVTMTVCVVISVGLSAMLYHGVYVNMGVSVMLQHCAYVGMYVFALFECSLNFQELALKN